MVSLSVEQRIKRLLIPNVKKLHVVTRYKSHKNEIKKYFSKKLPSFINMLLVNTR